MPLFGFVLGDALRFLELCSLLSSPWFLVVVIVAISHPLLCNLLSPSMQFLIIFYVISRCHLHNFLSLSSCFLCCGCLVVYVAIFSYYLLVFYFSIVLSLWFCFIRRDRLVLVVSFSTLQSSRLLRRDCLVFVVWFSILWLSWLLRRNSFIHVILFPFGTGIGKRYWVS